MCRRLVPKGMEGALAASAAWLSPSPFPPELLLSQPEGDGFHPFDESIEVAAVPDPAADQDRLLSIDPRRLGLPIDLARPLVVWPVESRLLCLATTARLAAGHEAANDAPATYRGNVGEFALQRFEAFLVG
jgi:hypothetical protein